MDYRGRLPLVHIKFVSGGTRVCCSCTELGGKYVASSIPSSLEEVEGADRRKSTLRTCRPRADACSARPPWDQLRLTAAKNKGGSEAKGDPPHESGPQGHFGRHQPVSPTASAKRAVETRIRIRPFKPANMGSTLGSPSSVVTGRGCPGTGTKEFLHASESQTATVCRQLHQRLSWP